MPPRQTPSTSPTHSPGCGWTLHPQEGHHPPREEHEASRAAAGNRTRKAGLGGGRGLNYHLLGPDAGPAHGGPTALRATSGPQVPSAGRGQGVRPGHSRGRQGWTNPSSQPHGVACGQSPCLTSCPPAHRPPGGAPPAPNASLLPGDGLEGPAGMSSCCFAHSPPQTGSRGRGQKRLPREPPWGLWALSTDPQPWGCRQNPAGGPATPGRARTGGHGVGLPHRHRLHTATGRTPQHPPGGALGTAPRAQGPWLRPWVEKPALREGPAQRPQSPWTARGRDQGAARPLGLGTRAEQAVRTQPPPGTRGPSWVSRQPPPAVISSTSPTPALTLRAPGTPTLRPPGAVPAAARPPWAGPYPASQC